MSVANVEMAAAWDGDEGDDWARDWERYERFARGYGQALLAAVDPIPGEHVLDVGCGTGQTARAAGRAVRDGGVLGVDLSSRMLERARQLALAEGLGNVEFAQADAQVHPFEAEAYDVVFSQFGAMFFGDAVTAFANIGRSLRPDGRLLLMAWRGLADNEWLQRILAALAVGRTLPVPPVGAPGPFGLADPDATRAALTSAGFDRVDIVPVDHPVWLGADADDAFRFIRGTGITRGMTKDLDETGLDRALDALRATMSEHDSGEGVRMGSGAWMVSACWPAR